jgi:hypothetical protein
MAAPKADPARCDLLGCGHIASFCSDGTEVDATGLKRPALKNLNVCANHTNWVHSDDAKLFAMTSDSYKKRA